MNPAWSVILLTTLIGAGQGLFLALFTVQSWALFGLAPAPASSRFHVGGSVVVLALLALGLVASFFHLGRPERAWRAAAMWRSSWLSREVIVLPATMAVVAAWGLAHAGAAPAPDGAADAARRLLEPSVALGALGSVLVLALFVCTAMIYASLRFLREWATPLTPLNFTLMGGASGFTLGAAWSAGVAGQPPGATRLLASWAVVLTLLAAAGRVAALARNAGLAPGSTLQTAIGIKHPRIVQTARGFGGDAYALREFCHGRSAGTLRAVQWAFLLGAFALPLVLLAAALAGPAAGAAALLPVAFALQFAGLIAERWHFFAQARHPQNLYYQARA